MNHRTLRFLLAVLFAAAVISQARFTADVIRDLTGDYPAKPFTIGDPWPTIQSVEPDAVALHVGDRVTAIDGHAVRGRGELARAVRQHKPGEMLAVTVERAGTEIEARVPLNALFGKPSGFFIFFAVVAWILVPWFSILVGFWVAAVRPRDGLAWIVLGILTGISQLYAPTALDANGWPIAIAAISTAFHALAFVGWSICMLLFGFYFPQRWQLDVKVPWLKWIFILPLTAEGLKSAFTGVLANWNVPAAESIPRLLPDTVFLILMMAGISFFFIGISSKYREPSLGPDDRRRLRLLYWGSTVSMTPMFLLVMYTFARYGRDPGDSEGIALVIAILMIFFFPATMAYVLVVQRAMDVRVVLRQGVQYTLARGGIRMVQALVIVAVIMMASNVLGSSYLSRPKRLGMVAAGVLVALRVREGGAWLRRWLDRRFFREAYNAEQLLGELGEQVRSILDRDELLHTVAHRIAETLHVERIAVLLLDGGSFRPALATGYGSSLDLSIPGDARTIRHLRSTRDPLVVNEPGELEGLDAQLLLPLSSRKALLGFISLGPKRSEEPYSRNDASLLRTVAMQTGLALENAQLSEAIASEIAERETLNREIEIAREVQQRLFPQSSPEVASIEYAGYCRPARGVGGDYYDFLALASGKLGLAIGDVSGKGIPAALLMASLQASVRGQSQAGMPVAELMTNVNRLVCEASAENRYATFFYGQFDPAARTLVYTNGGHNPPMVLRGQEVLRLEEGGPPVGLFPFSRYTQGEISLLPGDLLIFFTDGISEAENLQEEEWGEDALIETASNCAELTPSEAITEILAAADRFTAGAPQHDDMTLVLARMLPYNALK